jgi:kumamolisin
MSSRKLFYDSVIQLPEQGITPHGMMVNAIDPKQTDEEMTIQFSLSIPPDMQKKLEEKVEKGEIVSLAELNKTYSPKKADTDKLIAWLKSHQYKKITVSADSTSVYANAKVSQIANSLQVNMVRVTREGITYSAAQNAPSLPNEVANSVHAINGLQPFRTAPARDT